MAKLPRDLSCSDVERALSRLGFVLVHQRKHRMWVKGLVNTGTLRAIIREARISTDQFLAAL
jgi:predicted RNA binding protein YcfA (HicA-like mRNA interferase family)